MEYGTLEKYKTNLMALQPGGPCNPDSNGYVYVIGPDKAPVVKIGMAYAPQSRVTEMQTGCWETLSLLAVVSVQDGEVCELEAAAHKVAKDRGLHCRGEWFNCSVDQALECIIDAACGPDFAICSLSEAAEWAQEEALMVAAKRAASKRAVLRKKLGLDEMA